MFEQLAKNEDLVVKTTLTEHTETLRRLPVYWVYVALNSIGWESS
jgi:hypothetical protein